MRGRRYGNPAQYERNRRFGPLVHALGREAGGAMLPSERLRLNASKSESLPVRGDAAGVPPEGGPRQRLAASRYRGGPGRSRRLRRRSPKPAAGSSARNPIRRVERDARSLADDLGMDRGVVPSRAAASLRSAETKPFDPRDLPAPQTGESLGVRAAGRPPPSDGIPPTPSPGSGPRAGARPERRGRLLAPGRSEGGGGGGGIRAGADARGTAGRRDSGRPERGTEEEEEEEESPKLRPGGGRKSGPAPGCRRVRGAGRAVPRHGAAGRPVPKWERDGGRSGASKQQTDQKRKHKRRGARGRERVSEGERQRQTDRQTEEERKEERKGEKEGR